MARAQGALSIANITPTSTSHPPKRLTTIYQSSVVRRQSSVVSRQS